MIDLDELERLEKEAGIAPWNEDWCYGAVRHIHRNVDSESFFTFPEGADGDDVNGWDRYDGPFIAKLRNAAPDLIKLARWAERAKELLEEEKISWDWIGPLLKDYPQAEGEK